MRKHTHLYTKSVKTIGTLCGLLVVIGAGMVTWSDGRTEESDNVFASAFIMLIILVALKIDPCKKVLVHSASQPVLELPDSVLVFKGQQYDMFEEIGNYDTWLS